MKAFLDSKNILPAQLFSGSHLKCIFKGKINQERQENHGSNTEKKKRKRERSMQHIQSSMVQAVKGQERTPRSLENVADMKYYQIKWQFEKTQAS